MVPSFDREVKPWCSKELSGRGSGTLCRRGCGLVTGGDAGGWFGNGNVQRDDDDAAILDRPLQLAADLVEDIAEHADFLGEPLDGIVQGFAVVFARPLAWRHREKIVPDSEKPCKLLKAPQGGVRMPWSALPARTPCVFLAPLAPPVLCSDGGSCGGFCRLVLSGDARAGAAGLPSKMDGAGFRGDGRTH